MNTVMLAFARFPITALTDRHKPVYVQRLSAPLLRRLRLVLDDGD